MKKIGFIGIGVMGKSMVKHLMNNGFELSIYSRTKSKAEELIGMGARWCDTVAECVTDCDVVITIVGYPKDVEQVYFGDEGIVANAKKGAYLIDMTTTSPKLAQKIYEMGKPMGLKVMDAPVSGGDLGAQKGTLTIMVGGDREDFEACAPVFSAMGTNIVYGGGAGCGQHVKMANQISIAGALSGACEAVRYAEAMGVDLDAMLRTVSGGAGGSWQLANLGPKMVANDFAPGFFLKHFIKDMGLAIEESEGAGEHLYMLNTVSAMCRQLEERGHGEDGTQCLVEFYRSQSKL